MINEFIMVRRKTREHVSVGTVVEALKYPGVTLGGDWSVKHRGPGGTFWVGFGIFPTVIGHANPNGTGYGSDVWIGGFVEIAYHGVWTDIAISVQGTWPSGYTEGGYDTFKIVQTESPVVRRDAGEIPVTGEFGEEAADWDDDVYATIPTAFEVPDTATYW